MTNALVKPPLVAVVGPTATGKTDAGAAICLALGGEVVSMDAMQVYQGMRIGTARVKQEEARGIPHHMTACVPPDEPWSVAQYADDALAAIRGIRERGKLPVLVGGTGLYLEAIRRPMSFASSAADTRLRAELESLSGEELRERLRAVDPPTAARLPLGDRRRMIRAIEIAELTGKPMSSQADEPEERFSLCAMGLTMPRDILVRRIHERTERMFAGGLAEEVAALLRCGLPPDAQSMQAIGYKETVHMLRGEITRREAIESVAVATRQYAKRQMTWFRRTPGIRWFDRTEYLDANACHAAMITAIRERFGCAIMKGNMTRFYD